MSTQPPLPQSSSPRPHQVVLVTPETVEQDTMVKSGQLVLVKHAAVLKTSLLNAQRLNATNQLHVHQVKLKLVLTKLIHAAHQSAVLQMKNVKAASSLHAQMLLHQHVNVTKTALADQLMPPAAATNTIANATSQSATSSAISHVHQVTKELSLIPMPAVKPPSVALSTLKRPLSHQTTPLSLTPLQSPILSHQQNARSVLTRTVSKENMVNAGTTLMPHA